jgi:hypothetical protein
VVRALRRIAALPESTLEAISLDEYRGRAAG